MTSEPGDESDRLTRLGSELLTEYEATGEAGKADEAIRVLRQAIDSLPPGQRGWGWSNLGLAYSTRYLSTGAEADLTAAWDAHRKAVQDANEPTLRSRLLNNLAITLNSAWERSHDLGLLDAAVEALRAGLALSPVEPGVRAELASNLTASVMRRFDELGHTGDLATAIDAMSAAVIEVPESDAQRPMYLQNAAVLVQQLRAAQLGDVKLLDRTIELQRRIAGDQPEALWTLGNLLHERYGIAGSRDDLDDGVRAAGRAVELAEEGSRLWALAQGSLAGLLVDRVEFTDDVADLDRAEAALREALAVTDQDASERPGYLNVLGVTLSDRYDRTGDPEDLAGSLRAHQEAVDTSRDPERAGYVRNLSKHLSRFGPLDSTFSIADLAGAVVTGIVTEEGAHDRAGADTDPPSPAEIEQTLALAADAASEGDTFRAYLLSSLLLARADPVDSAWPRVAIAYLHDATNWLAQHPNYDLFHMAAAVGDDLLDRVEDEDSDIASRALIAVARLLTDTVFGAWRGEDLERYQDHYDEQSQYDFWLRPNVSADEPDIERPDPVALAGRALELLNRALPAARGRIRGQVLVHLARVERLVTALNGPVGNPVEHAYEALRFLDRDRDAGHRVYMWFILVGEGERPAEVPADLRPRPWSSVVAEAGPAEALRHAYHAARTLSMLGVEDETREWFGVVGPHVFESGSPGQRQLFWALEAHYLHDDILECPEVGFDLIGAAEAILEAAAGSGFSREQATTALVHLAYHAHSSRQFQAGVDLLDQATAMDPGLPDRLGPVHTYIRATLCAGAAADFAQQGDIATALAAHAATATALLRLGLTDSAIDVIERMALHAADDSATVVDEVCALVPAVLARVGDDRLPQLMEICQAVAQSTIDPVSAVLIHQVVKGLRFAIVMTAPGPVPARPDEEDRLASVAELEAQLGLETSAVLAGVGVDDEMLMSSYIGMADLTSGRRMELVAANAQRHYDRGLAALVLRSRVGRNPYLTLDDIQRWLDDDTVLVSILLGGPSLQLLTITRSDATVDVLTPTSRLSSIPITILLTDYIVHMHGLGPTVAQLRREVRDDSLFRPVTRRGQQLLTSVHGACVPARLAALQAAGKTHLCFWPHGPFHVVPFHLLGTPERVLADDWTVSVVPGLWSLTPSADATGSGLLSVGSADGGVAYGLASEPLVEDQAASIASVFGTSALVGPAATPPAVLRRIETSRYVHIAAHGSINEIAPAFHCLYLSGGRLFAHDLMRVDLSGVETVTLSTCESALGRFDLGDEPRGIPSALFIAGVRTVVGCLWPVHPDPADMFFAAFYERLLVDHDRLAAFQEAQRSTRQSYPAFRDWGAFTLIGHWLD